MKKNINQDIANFLARGGKITNIPRGASVFTVDRPIFHPRIKNNLTKKPR